MEILIREGKPCPVPPHWKRFIVPWAQVLCFETSFGLLLAQELELMDLRLCFWTMMVTDPATVCPEITTSLITFVLTLEGIIPCKLPGAGEKVLEKGYCQILYVPPGICEVIFNSGEYQGMHIEFRTGFRERLAFYDKRLATMVQQPAGTGDRTMALPSIPLRYTTMAIIDNLKHCDKKDGALLLEMHKFSLELISEYTGSLEEIEEEQVRPNLPYRERMMRVRDFIVAAPNINLHTLKKIAQQFGIGEAIIKREFRILFGQTLSMFVRQQALAKAHKMVSGTRESIDSIADEIGYSGREAFEASFKKHYGYPPSRIRKKRNP